jgi:hypothetical protein
VIDLYPVHVNWYIKSPDKFGYRTVMNRVIIFIIILFLLFLNAVYCTAQQDITVLKQQITDNSVKIRLEAVTQLAKLGTKDAENTVLEAFNREKDTSLKIEIIRLLPVFQSTDTVNLLLSIVKDTAKYNKDIRKSAMISLNYYSENSSIKQVISDILDNPNENQDIQVQAIQNLAVSESTESVRILGKTVKTKKGQVQDIALAELDKKSDIGNKQAEKELTDLGKSSDKTLQTKVKNLKNKGKTQKK